MKVLTTAFLVLFSVISTQQSMAAALSNGSTNSGHIYSYDNEVNDTNSVASQFVRSAQLYKSLSLLLLDSVKTDEVVEKAISRHGFTNVKKAVIHNIKEITTSYRQKWDHLLADIYSKQFNSEILQSIMEKGEHSPYFPQFVSRQKSGGTDKTLISSEIFKEARSDLIVMLQNNLVQHVTASNLSN